MVEFDRSAFIAKFQEEAADLLQRLNEGIIAIEIEPTSRPLLDQWLRDAHTLKGSSRMVGLIEISDIAHRMEDVMVLVRDGALDYTPDMSESFFEALDTVVYLTESARTSGAVGADVEGLTARLAALAGDGTSYPATPAGPGATAVRDAMPGPASSGPSAEPTPVQAPATAEELAAAQVQPAMGPPHAHADNRLHTREQSTVRVRTSQVDRLLNLVSEVVISQIKSEQRVRELRPLGVRAAAALKVWDRISSSLGEAETSQITGPDVQTLRDLLSDQRKAIASISKAFADDISREASVVGDLQVQAMELRMLPVNTVFNAFPRAVRDLARQHSKDVDLIIEGGDTELDRKVLEEISDPLVHILRNAIDHGIEPGLIRVAAGKSQKGTIRLSARQEGDHIVIEVADDGAGIDPTTVRSAAVRKGYLTAAEAGAMSDRETRYLIFEKGFSTAAIITEISGRGVGMDVVREFVVERLKGALDVESEPGEGALFRLTIPLTLAVIRALLLHVEGQTFALPTSAIEETVQIGRAEVVSIEGREAIRRQRRTIPLVHLRDILGMNDIERVDGSTLAIVILGFSGHRIGLVVDEVLNEQQVVIKSLGTHLRRVEHIAGVTVLGAGEVVPILDIGDLVTRGRQLTGAGVRSSAGRQAPGAEGRPGRILICEDSFTTRELERSIFEAAGYEVETAPDGAAGLARLRGGVRPDAVVTDVQMPRMTGFELTRAIRADDRLSAIPVIIVTSLERDEEKAEGIAAGADAYITKSVFNQDTLLDTVGRLLR